MITKFPQRNLKVKSPIGISCGVAPHPPPPKLQKHQPVDNFCCVRIYREVQRDGRGRIRTKFTATVRQPQLFVYRRAALEIDSHPSVRIHRTKFGASVRNTRAPSRPQQASLPHAISQLYQAQLSDVK